MVINKKVRIMTKRIKLVLIVERKATLRRTVGAVTRRAELRIISNCHDLSSKGNESFESTRKVDSGHWIYSAHGQ